MRPDPPGRDRSITASAFLFLLSGFLGIPFSIAGYLYIGATGELPGVAGIRFWGDAAFEAWWGVEGVRLSLAAWLVLGVLETIVGVGLWRSSRRAGIMGLALTPFAAVFLIGYGAPFAWVVVPLRVILLVLGWGSLTDARVEADATAAPSS